MTNYIARTIGIVLIVGTIGCKENIKGKGFEEPISDSLKLSRLPANEKKFLLQKEIDTILKNWDDYLSNSEFRNMLSVRVKARRDKIVKYTNDPVNNRNNYVHSAFKRYLTPEELGMLNFDSMEDLLRNIELVEKRQAKIRVLLKNGLFFLSDGEINEFIKDGFQNADYYDELGAKRNRERIESYTSQIDSLRKIIYPVDSVIPFGPKVLLQISNQAEGKISFTTPIGQPMTDMDSINAQKQIFEAWTFFLELNEIVDNSTYEDSYGKFLPTIDTYDFILEDPEYHEEGYRREFREIDLNNSFYSIRIGNIGKYEVYYYIQRIGDSLGCHPYGELKVEECCYTSWFGCDYEGYLLLYNRPKKYAKIMHAYYTGSRSFRFFSISSDKDIHIYQGYKTDNRDLRFENEIPADSVSMGLQEAYSVKVLANGETFIQKNNIN